MKHFARIAIAAVLFAVSVNVYAAKGDVKSKKAVVLRFSGFDLKGFNSLNIFTKTGFLMKTSSSLNNADKVPQTGTLSNFVTVQKGNAMFIMPYKQKSPLSLFKTPAPPKF